MALPPVLHRFDVALAHVDRGLELALTVSVARHPSETVERLWLRLLAFCLFHAEGLAFGPGLCEPDEPDLAAPDPRGGRALLVRVGKPEPERVARDVERGGGARVAVLFESERRLEGFLEAARAEGRRRAGDAELVAAPADVVRALGQREGRREKVQVTVVGDHLYLDVGGQPLDGPLVRGRYDT